MKYFKLNIDDRGIATLTFDTPHSKVNTFTALAMKALEQYITQLEMTPNIKALFIESAKEAIFIAGADIHEIKEAKEEKQIISFVKQGQELFNKIALLPFPSIAVIDGACLGGGLELALACTYRIASNHEHTRLGLPEVNLGIIPGFGGTQRLPTLVGYAKAMELMVAGKRLKGDKALKLGLVDASVPQGYLAFKKEEFIQAILDNTLNAKIIQKRQGFKWYEHFSLSRMLIGKITLRAVLKKTKGNYPAPLKLIEVLQNTYKKPLKKGLEIECQSITQLLQTEVSKNLIELFLISEELKHESFVTNKTTPLKIKQSAVVGTGAMGSGIAWALNNLDIDV
jgi:3-hydroxyacyl-CoA dehydrogenase/enoyl-CoA hydratase/3-hydroxybutyryl-CoA epimerase